MQMTQLYTSKNDLSKIQTSLQFDFNLIQTWFSSNLLLLNKKKSYSMLFATRSALHKQNNSLKVKFQDGTPLMNVDEIKYMGLGLTFSPHIDYCFTRLKIITQLLLPIIVYQNTFNLEFGL